MVDLPLVLKVLEDIAPTRLAQSWDNVGLLVGDPARTIAAAFLCVDYTPATAAEARAMGCDLVVAYHPPIFHPIKRLTAPSLIFDAIEQRIAIYSPHTALDVADGGTNDMLADALGLADRRPLRTSSATPTQCKLIVFVPPDHADAVAKAIFDAGAGQIGDYSCCSFRSPGVGTFFGRQGANPAVGQAGRLERVDELRLETLVPLDRVTQVVGAMRSVHPYEEPAFDLVQLAPLPAGVGIGRIGRFDRPVATRDLIERVKRELGLSHLLVAGPTDGQIATAACAAGACGDLLDDALRQRAWLYLTGELRHHDALRAAHSGMTVVCTLHSNSERAVLKRLATRLAAAVPQIAVHVSQADRDPFNVV
jgi:dinuclear metal center YbgI/SA1388 family protein